VKLGDVLRKEREKKKLSLEQTASQLGLSEEQYREIEAGNSGAEIWGSLLAEIAIKVEKPTSRLLAESGKSADTKPGQAGPRIKKAREDWQQHPRHDPAQLTPEKMAEALEISLEEYQKIEAGESGIEEWGPILLHFAELIEQPVFNLFYPCGLSYKKLDDYP
jgi:transcriptional regulator with XRE-family HTH domain